MKQKAFKPNISRRLEPKSMTQRIHRQTNLQLLSLHRRSVDVLARSAAAVDKSLVVNSQHRERGSVDRRAHASALMREATDLHALFDSVMANQPDMAWEVIAQYRELVDQMRDLYPPRVFPHRQWSDLYFIFKATRQSEV
jgi:hypothetical protein